MIKKVLEALFDRPLESPEYLVNREEELRSLNLIVSLQPSGVYGVCGETGVGKTTVLNFLQTDEGKKLSLVLTEKEDKKSIVADVLYRLARAVLKTGSKELEISARKAIEFVVEERGESKSLGVSGGLVVEGNITKTSTSITKFNPYQAYELLDELLEHVLATFGKCVLVIDELDKERKEEVLEVLDSLKGIFDKQDLIVVISLPFAIYREYARDRLRWNESGNLENILKDVIFIEPLDDDHVIEMILRRLKDFPDYFEREVLEEIAKFSDGNPRDALWVSQQIVLDNIGKKKIYLQDAQETVRKLVKGRFEGFLELTELQEQLLKAIAVEGQATRQAVVKKMESRGMKRQTIYTYIKRFIEGGLVIERRGVLRVSGKIRYLLER